MEEARIEFARAAWKNFLKLAPSPGDTKRVREELIRLRSDPEAGIPVPFNQWDNCYLTWSEEWLIIYKKEGEGIFVVLIDKDTE
ncbi:MAG: hypothetical protein WBX38_15625 [Candidatus Sulfotelmatobacter sp.]